VTDFHRAEFTGREAVFNKASFMHETYTDFGQTSWHVAYGASFVDARFHGYISFIKATFQAGGSSFCHASFGRQLITFGGAQFGGQQITFADAVLAASPDFQGASFEAGHADFRNLDLADGARVDLRGVYKWRPWLSKSPQIGVLFPEEVPERDLLW
jgi:hypothetical protein